MSLESLEEASLTVNRMRMEGKQIQAWSFILNTAAHSSSAPALPTLSIRNNGGTKDEAGEYTDGAALLLVKDSGNEVNWAVNVTVGVWDSNIPDPKQSTKPISLALAESEAGSKDKVKSLLQQVAAGKKFYIKQDEAVSATVNITPPTQSTSGFGQCTGGGTLYYATGTPYSLKDAQEQFKSVDVTPQNSIATEASDNPGVYASLTIPVKKDKTLLWTSIGIGCAAVALLIWVLYTVLPAGAGLVLITI